METTFAQRVIQVIEASGCNKSEFAKRINVSQAFVSQICSGVRSPSDRTIQDICRIFNINQRWLCSGEGEMRRQLNRDTEIESFVNEIMYSEDTDFRRRLVGILARLTVDEWALLESKAWELVGKPQNSITIKLAGRDGSKTEEVLTDEEANQRNAEYEQYRDASQDL